jgi:hypothetical protein
MQLGTNCLLRALVAIACLEERDRPRGSGAAVAATNRNSHNSHIYTDIPLIKL